MRIVGAIALAAALGGCTSVKMVQRDGCWIRRTEKSFGRVQEEIGPCMRSEPKWVADRLTRLVQECAAQADYRWQVLALEAWRKAKPYPAQPPQDEILRTCMGEARVGMVDENNELKRRVADLSADRDSLRVDVDQDRAHLRATHDQIARYLGEAANKPPAPATATATATSDGKATNESGAMLTSGSTSGSGATGAPAVPAQAAAKPAIGDANAAVPKRAARPARASCRACDVPGVQPEARAPVPASDAAAGP